MHRPMTGAGPKSGITKVPPHTKVGTHMAHDSQLVQLLKDLGRCWEKGLAGMYDHIIHGLEEAEGFPHA